MRSLLIAQPPRNRRARCVVGDDLGRRDGLALAALLGDAESERTAPPRSDLLATADDYMHVNDRLMHSACTDRRSGQVR